MDFLSHIHLVSDRAIRINPTIGTSSIMQFKFSPKNKLVMSTAIVAAFAGYGRRAYAANTCTASGSTYSCSGASSTSERFPANGAAVSTTSAFNVTAPAGTAAVVLTGSGALSFTDNNASTLIGDGGGIFIQHYIPDQTNPGPVSVTMGSGSKIITSAGSGVYLYTRGGSTANPNNVSITMNGSITANTAFRSAPRLPVRVIFLLPQGQEVQ